MFLAYGLAASVLLASMHAWHLKRNQTNLASDGGSFKALLDRNDPDLVLIGNSVVAENVDRFRLERELSRCLHRSIRVLFLTEPGSPSAWWYLALKHQVALSRLRSVPVGIIFFGPDLVSLNQKLSEHQLWAIASLLPENDPIFMAKTHGRYGKTLGSLRRLPTQRRSLAQFLLGLWTQAVSVWLPGRVNARAELENRFALRQEAALPRDTPLPTVIEDGAICEALERCADETFLPDILSAAPNVRLFLVETHRRPGSVETAEMVRLRRELPRYITAHGTKYFSLQTRPELENRAYYRDVFHLTTDGRRENTSVLADEILSHGLLGSDQGGR